MGVETTVFATVFISVSAHPSLNLSVTISLVYMSKKKGEWNSSLYGNKIDVDPSGSLGGR